MLIVSMLEFPAALVSRTGGRMGGRTEKKPRSRWRAGLSPPIPWRREETSCLALRPKEATDRADYGAGALFIGATHQRIELRAGR